MRLPISAIARYANVAPVRETSNGNDGTTTPNHRPTGSGGKMIATAIISRTLPGWTTCSLLRKIGRRVRMVETTSRLHETRRCNCKSGRQESFDLAQRMQPHRINIHRRCLERTHCRVSGDRIAYSEHWAIPREMRSGAINYGPLRSDVCIKLTTHSVCMRGIVNVGTPIRCLVLIVSADVD